MDASQPPDGSNAPAGGGAPAPAAPEIGAEPAQIAADAELDARGLLCPLPVLKARKRLSALGVGAVLRVRADDPAAVIDVPHFCAEQGHALIAHSEGAEGEHVFVLRKGG